MTFNLPQHAMSLDKPFGWSAVATVRFVGQKAERKNPVNPGLANRALKKRVLRSERSKPPPVLHNKPGTHSPCIEFDPIFLFSLKRTYLQLALATPRGPCTGYSQLPSLKLVMG